jgi:hypothetical protein
LLVVVAVVVVVMAMKKPLHPLTAAAVGLMGSQLIPLHGKGEAHRSHWCIREYPDPPLATM